MTRHKVLPPVKDVAEIAKTIRELRRRASEDVIEIGRLLVTARRVLEHGEWYQWLEAEFAWSRQTADNHIRVYERFGKGKTLTVSALEPTSLYALAQRSTPPQAVTTVVKLIEAGKAPSAASVKKIIREIKSPPPPDDAPLPPPKPSRSVREAALAEQFRAAVSALLALAARPSKNFVGAIPAGDLDMVANFLKQIAAAGNTARETVQ